MLKPRRNINRREACMTRARSVVVLTDVLCILCLFATVMQLAHAMTIDERCSCARTDRRVPPCLDIMAVSQQLMLHYRKNMCIVNGVIDRYRLSRAHLTGRTCWFYASSLCI